MKFLVQHKFKDMDNEWHTETKFKSLPAAIGYTIVEAEKVESVDLEYRVKIESGGVLMKVKALGSYV